MGQVQLSDKQRSFIFYLVHQGKRHTEAARLAGFAAPRQSAFTLTQSPKIIAKIRQERNKVYQTELASTAVKTLKEVMEDTEVQCKDCSSQDVPGVGWRHWEAFTVPTKLWAKPCWNDTGRIVCYYWQMGRRKSGTCKGYYTFLIKGPVRFLVLSYI